MLQAWSVRRGKHSQNRDSAGNCRLPEFLNYHYYEFLRAWEVIIGVEGQNIS